MNREELLRRISQAQFAAWETHLFLDTHPDDEAARKNMMAYQAAARKLKDEYEKTFGPLTTSDMYGDTRFEWINGPWPWDVYEEAKR